MYPNNVEKTLKKYTKPQLLAIEKVLKEAICCALVAFPFALFINMDAWGKDLFEASKDAAIFCVFCVFVPYGAIKGSIMEYIIFRRQILEEDEPPAETSRAGEENAATYEINKLERTVEDLAVQVAVLQQQIQTLNQSHWQEKDTKK